MQKNRKIMIINIPINKLINYFVFFVKFQGKGLKSYF